MDRNDGDSEDDMDQHRRHFHGRFISRRICSIWCWGQQQQQQQQQQQSNNGRSNRKRLLVRCTTIPVAFIQRFMNELRLYPTSSQVLRMLKCVRFGRSGNENGLRFGEMCLFANCLRRLNYLNDLKLEFALNRKKFTGNPEVFLGGSCNPTTWRADTAIPALKKYGISFFNPQVQSWSPDLMAVEQIAKDSASLLLFMADNQTRNIAGMLEIAYLTALNRNVVLVMYPYVRQQFINNEMLTSQEYVDLIEARELLLSLTRLQNVSIFDSLPLALNFIDALFDENSSFDDFFDVEFEKLRSVFDHFDYEQKNELSITQLAFACRKLLKYSLSFSELENILNSLPNSKTVTFDNFCSIVADLNDCGFRQMRLGPASSSTPTPSSSPSSFAHRYHYRNQKDLQSKRPRRKHNVLLGGTKNSNWRQEYAVPALQTNGISWCDPVELKTNAGGESGRASETASAGADTEPAYTKCSCVVEIMQNYLELSARSDLMLFVIDDSALGTGSRTRRNGSGSGSGSSSVTLSPLTEMLLAAYFIGLKQCPMILCFTRTAEHYREDSAPAVAGEQLSNTALKDYNRGRQYLIDFAKRESIPVFESISDSLYYIIDWMKRRSF